MPLPTLTPEDRERLSELQQRIIDRVYEHWADFEQPLKYGVIAGALNRAATRHGTTARTLVDACEQMGYIQRIPTETGSQGILLPYGVFERLPPHKREPWRNPTKKKREDEREMDFGRKVRLLPEERDVPLKNRLGDDIPPPKPIAQSLPEPKPDTKPAAPVAQPELKNALKSILRDARGEALLSSEQKGKPE